MAPITPEDLEQRFMAQESHVRRAAKLATIAEDPDAVMEMPMFNLVAALGEDAHDITVADFLAAFSREEHSGNGTRIIGPLKEKVQQEIMELLLHYGGLGCRDISKMLSLPSRKVGAVLSGMRDDGLIQSHGQKAGTVYFAQKNS